MEPFNLRGLVTLSCISQQSGYMDKNFVILTDLILGRVEPQTRRFWVWYQPQTTVQHLSSKTCNLEDFS